MSDLSIVHHQSGLPAEALLPAQQQDSQTIREKSSESDAGGEVEWTYPDGGLRAWLVVLGCFIMSCTCMQVSVGFFWARR